MLRATESERDRQERYNVVRGRGREMGREKDGLGYGVVSSGGEYIWA